MEIIKIAIVGTGSIARTGHMPAYLQRDDIRLIACADIDFEKAKSFAGEFGIPKAYASLDELLAHEKPDIVDVCTWVAAHAECVIAAARAGCHVMCEKPLSDTMEAARRMRAAIRESGVNFMLAVPLRYSKGAEYVRSMVDRGAFGEVYYGKTAYIRSRGIPGGWFSCKKYSGGGPLIDIGVHRIDLAWYLMGSPKPYSVSAVAQHRIGDYREQNDGAWCGTDVPDYTFDTEDSAHGFIRFVNGASLYFDASWTFNGEETFLTQIAGSRCGCQYDSFRFFPDPDGSIAANIPESTFRGEMFDGEIDHFLRCVRTGKKPYSDIDEACTLEAMLCAVYESAETGHEVILDL